MSVWIVIMFLPLLLVISLGEFVTLRMLAFGKMVSLIKIIGPINITVV